MLKCTKKQKLQPIFLFLYFKKFYVAGHFTFILLCQSNQPIKVQNRLEKLCANYNYIIELKTLLKDIQFYSLSIWFHESPDYMKLDKKVLNYFEEIFVCFSSWIRWWLQQFFSLSLCFVVLKLACRCNKYYLMLI